ncbi:hypothetical protein BH09PAT2_BH09PAT2_02160 [soil metagenome]
MEIEFVSKKVLYICLLASSILLLIFTIYYQINTSYIYLCNEKDILDIYLREKKQDIIIKPQNIKNSLTCIGRGMPYYDRTIESIVGSVSSSMLTVFKKRYTVNKNLISSLDENSLQCIKSKTTYLIIQKNIVVNELLSNLNSCKPNTIVMSAKYKNSKIIRALKSQKYEVMFINKGDYKKILL